MKKVELLQMIEKSPPSGKMNKVHVQLFNRERKNKGPSSMDKNSTLLVINQILVK